jgi:hypothetical protein
MTAPGRHVLAVVKDFRNARQNAGHFMFGRSGTTALRCAGLMDANFHWCLAERRANLAT